MNYNMEFVMNQYSDGSGKPSNLASGASIKELPEMYIHFAHHDFDIVWDDTTNRQIVKRDINKFYGGMGEGSSFDSWKDALLVTLYDAYQVSDELKKGDTITATYMGETVIFECIYIHVVIRSRRMDNDRHQINL